MLVWSKETLLQINDVSLQTEAVLLVNVLKLDENLRWRMFFSCQVWEPHPGSFLVLSIGQSGYNNWKEKSWISFTQAISSLKFKPTNELIWTYYWQIVATKLSLQMERE